MTLLSGSDPTNHASINTELAVIEEEEDFF